MNFLIEKTKQTMSLKEITDNQYIGYIYAIKTSFSVKIGMSKNIQQRINTHKITYGGGDYYISNGVTNYREIEKMVHDFFKKKLLFGEHFDISLKQAKKAIDMVCRDIGKVDISFIVKENFHKDIKNEALMDRIDKKFCSQTERYLTIPEYCHHYNLSMISYEFYLSLADHLVKICRILNVNYFKVNVLDGYFQETAFDTDFLDSILPNLLTGAFLYKLIDIDFDDLTSELVEDKSLLVIDHAN